MIKVVYIFLLAFISVFIQVLIGSSIGLILPIIAFSIFYLAVITDWQTGMLTAAITGSIVDTLYGETMFLTPVVLVIIALLAILWLHKGNLKYLPLQTLPAGGVGFIYACPNLFVACHVYEYGFQINHVLEKLLFVALSVVLSSLIFPLFIMLMDKLNIPLKFNTYTKSQKRIADGE